MPFSERHTKPTCTHSTRWKRGKYEKKKENGNQKLAKTKEKKTRVALSAPGSVFRTLLLPVCDMMEYTIEGNFCFGERKKNCLE